MKLLAILVGADGTAACLDAATTLARAADVPQIEALNVEVDPERLVAASEEIDIQRLRESHEGSAGQRSAAVHAAYAAWFADSHEDAARVEWKSVVGAEAETVKAEAAQADVVVIVMAREGSMDGSDALEAAIFGSGKPTLLVPADWRAGKRKHFDHVVVALSNTDIAEHAIAGSATILRKATRVTALRIGSEDDPATGLISDIEALGITPELHIVARGEGDLGEQIASEAQALGADLIVAGAYRHGEIIEWLAGGTTRHLLAAAKLPLLLAH